MERPDLWFIIRYGTVHSCWQWPLVWGTQTAYYDGWHFAMHCGFFSVQVYV